MLDSFWFAKRTGSEGTDVKSLQGGQNLGEITDLLYFVRKLYKSLKVPVNRIDPESAYGSTDATVLREELKFAKFIVRLQQTFAGGLKEAFVTHLKLKKMWDEYRLKESYFSLEFNPPSSYHELREQQKFELKQNNYNNMSQNELVSNSYSQKKYLGWRDRDILDNREFLRKDAELQWELGQIQAAGPAWKEMAVAGEVGEGDAAAVGGEGGGVGSSPMGGGGEIPEFGGGPADVGGDEVEVAAETEVDAEETAAV